MRRQVVVVIALALSLAAFRTGRAWAVIASDNAANYGSWGDGANAGTGFAGAWAVNNFSGNGSGGGFLAVSNSESNVDNATKAWGIFGHSGGIGQASRSLSSAINVGEAIFVDMDNGLLDPSGSPPPTVGVALQNSMGNSLAEFYFVGGGSNYTFNASGVSLVGSAQGFTNQGLRLQFTLTSPTSLTLTIDRLINGSIDATYTGNLFSPAGGQAITKIRLFNANAGSPNSNNAFFNNILVSIVPEASSAWFGALIFGAAGLTWCGRRFRDRYISRSAV